MASYEELYNLIIEHGGAHRKVYNAMHGKEYEKQYRTLSNVHKSCGIKAKDARDTLDEIHYLDTKNNAQTGRRAHEKGIVRNHSMKELVKTKAADKVGYKGLHQDDNAYSDADYNRLMKDELKLEEFRLNHKPKSEITKKLDEKLGRVKESVDSIKLEIFESWYSGEISLEERDLLLQNF